ncbi:MAG: hypothetical protein D6765_06120 [Bacteroidetes bacterium]|nr:MAG: hypothetical protein D6765_06120 [Bacteroidota bacterium]
MQKGRNPESLAVEQGRLGPFRRDPQAPQRIGCKSLDGGFGQASLPGEFYVLPPERLESKYQAQDQLNDSIHLVH